MGTAAGMLAEARRWLGTGEPNAIQRWYAGKHGAAYSGNQPWCDMAVTYWAHQSDNVAAVLPGGDRAYTVSHASDFRHAGRWLPGTAANVDQARPGDIVFFDWGASNSISAIDHVGVVEKALGGGRVQTIEGNTGDQCLRRVRSADVIAGLGRPAYDDQEDDDMKPSDSVPVGKTYDKAFAHDSYPASYLWVGAYAEAKAARAAAEAGNAAIAELSKTVAALAADRGQQVDADALVERITAAIESVTVRLDVTEDAS